MKASGSVSEEEIREAIQTRFGFVQQHRKQINEGLDGLGVDHVGALAVSATPRFIVHDRCACNLKDGAVWPM